MQRTRNSLIFIVATCVLFLARSTICDESANKNKTASAAVETIKTQKTAVANVTKDVIKLNQNNNNSNGTTAEQQTGKNITSKSASTVVSDKTVIEHHSISEQPTIDGHSPTVNSGALWRGFFVLIGLGVLALAYMVFRSFGLNKPRPQMVRKYGVLAHRQDIEMRPLPLDEEEDDDTTVFDVSGLASSRAQS